MLAVIKTTMIHCTNPKDDETWADLVGVFEASELAQTATVIDYKQTADDQGEELTYLSDLRWFEHNLFSVGYLSNSRGTKYTLFYSVTECQLNEIAS